MAPTDSPKTLHAAILHFSNIDTCQDALVAARWPDGVICPTCGSRDVGYLANQRRWQCCEKHARRQFSVKVGTIFEDSPISLSKWFTAIWLIGNAKNGISSYEIHRAIGVTQKTAWFMLHRIRLAMQTKSFNKIGGEVEIDETFIGGKARFMHKGRRERVIKGTGGMGKVAVMGLLERHGPDGHSTVRTHVVASTKKKLLQAAIRAEVAKDTSIFTDALKSYDGLNEDYVHQVIDHAERYVNGQIHTNGCENFWSLLKRALKGTYVSVEPFHLFRYVDEEAFRFNTRKAKDGDRFDDMTRRVTGRRVTYKELTGHMNDAGQTA
jgi:transposase-like protein